MKGSRDRLWPGSVSNGHSNSDNSTATINYSNNSSSSNISSYSATSAQWHLQQPRHRSLPSAAISSTPINITYIGIETSNSNSNNHNSQLETFPPPLVSASSLVQSKQLKSISIKNAPVLKTRTISTSDSKLRRSSDPVQLSTTIDVPVKNVDSGVISFSIQQQQQQKQQLSLPLTDHLYAGATFQNSPAPSNLPIPIFNGAKTNTPGIFPTPASAESTSYSSPTPISSALTSNYLGYHPEQVQSRGENSRMRMFVNQSQFTGIDTGIDRNNKFIPATLAAPQGFVPRQQHASINTNHSVSKYPTTTSVALTPSLARLSMTSIPPPPQHPTDGGMFSMDSVRSSFDVERNSHEFAVSKVEQGFFDVPPPPTAIKPVFNGVSNFFGSHTTNFIPSSSPQFVYPSSVNYMQHFQHGAQIYAFTHNETVQLQYDLEQTECAAGKKYQQLHQQQQHERIDHNMVRRSFGNNIMIPPSVIVGSALTQNRSLKTVVDNRDVSTPLLGAMSQNLKNLLKISH
ncbi:hypothetical protein HK100_006288 [Physocladia obscura]|uniref:Uncharacterized protein n=1 Tax=Physocladia obscura TaxID=109957 RepID=A0AAD5T804_9FUNG|nr:hypothetical protein HK100_006288 [Physocladia obscura]